MDEPLFERPHAGLAESYRSLVREFIDNGEDLVPFPLTFPNDDFSAFLDRLQACSEGLALPEGFVPHTTYWLVHRGEVVAVSNLRHSLTDSLRKEGGNIGYGVRPSERRKGFATEILRRTLEQARNMGLTQVLVTCRSTNEGSIRAILSNGGVFDSQEWLPERAETVNRYTIGLS